MASRHKRKGSEPIPDREERERLRELDEAIRWLETGRIEEQQKPEVLKLREREDAKRRRIAEQAEERKILEELQTESTAEEQLRQLSEAISWLERLLSDRERQTSLQSRS